MRTYRMLLGRTRQTETKFENDLSSWTTGQLNLETAFVNMQKATEPLDLIAAKQIFSDNVSQYQELLILEVSLLRSARQYIERGEMEKLLPRLNFMAKFNGHLASNQALFQRVSEGYDKTYGQLPTGAKPLREEYLADVRIKNVKAWPTYKLAIGQHLALLKMLRMPQADFEASLVKAKARYGMLVKNHMDSIDWAFVDYWWSKQHDSLSKQKLKLLGKQAQKSVEEQAMERPAKTIAKHEWLLIMLALSHPPSASTTDAAPTSTSSKNPFLDDDDKAQDKSQAQGATNKNPFLTEPEDSDQEDDGDDDYSTDDDDQ
jgi:hypothetical protein